MTLNIGQFFKRDIKTDTEIDPKTTAKEVIKEFLNVIRKKIPDYTLPYNELVAERLAEDAICLYNSNKNFRRILKKKNSDSMEHLRGFMKFNLAELIADVEPKVYAEIPPEFYDGPKLSEED